MEQTSATSNEQHDPVVSQLLGTVIVLDLATPYVCIGTVAGGDHRYLYIDDADLHDLRDSHTTREQYIVDARRHGVGTNRQRVYIRREEIVAFSRLEDVVV